MSNPFELYQQYVGNPTARAVGGFGRGMFGLEQPEYLQNELGREAYRTGQAVGNMPAIAGPVGAVKAAAQVPDLIGSIVIGSKAVSPAAKRLFSDIADMKKLKHIEPDIEKYINKTHSAWKDPVTQRYMQEIDDSVANFTPNTEFTKAMSEGYLGSKKLGEIFDHPELFEAYPELKDYKVSFVGNRNNSGQTSGYFMPKSKEIEIVGSNVDDARKTLLHEIQHAVQAIEGWPRGGSSFSMITGEKAKEKAENAAKLASKAVSPELKTKYLKQEELWKNLSNFSDSPEGQYAAYRALWGEQQAETVAQRADLSSAWRGPTFKQDMSVGTPAAIPLTAGIDTLPYQATPDNFFLNPLLQDSIGDTTR